MALRVLSAPATELLTTLDRLKDELGIPQTDTSDDDVLYDTLVRASSAIVRTTGRTFLGVATYQETLAGSGSQLLALSNVPVLAVTEVLADQDALPTLVDDRDDGYAIEDAQAGALYRPSGWTRGSGARRWGQESYGSRYILPLTSGTLRYSVTYSAGYLLPYQRDYLPYDPTAGSSGSGVPAQRSDPPPLPGAIEQACLLTTKGWYLARARDKSVQSQSIGTVTVHYAPDAAAASGVLPTAALGLLHEYRRIA